MQHLHLPASAQIINPTAAAAAVTGRRRFQQRRCTGGSGGGGAAAALLLPLQQAELHVRHVRRRARGPAGGGGGRGKEGWSRQRRGANEGGSVERLQRVQCRERGGVLRVILVDVGAWGLCV